MVFVLIAKQPNDVISIFLGPSVLEIKLMDGKVLYEQLHLEY
jgi:hypothetical protein